MGAEPTDLRKQTKKVLKFSQFSNYCAEIVIKRCGGSCESLVVSAMIVPCLVKTL